MTLIGSGSAHSATRSTGPGACSRSRSVSRAAIVRTAGRSAATRRAVNTRDTSPRSREWSSPSSCRMEVNMSRSPVCARQSGIPSRAKRVSESLPASGVCSMSWTPA